MQNRRVLEWIKPNCNFSFSKCVYALYLTYALICLHWLRVPERMRSEVAVLVYMVLHSCAPLPWPVHLLCRPSKSPRTSLFLQRLPRLASGSPLHCWQPSIFGCWPSSGVELSATGGYVGTVSGDLLHSTQDISFYYVIF